jgi:hypothetical protein
MAPLCARRGRFPDGAPAPPRLLLHLNCSLFMLDTVTSGLAAEAAAALRMAPALADLAARVVAGASARGGGGSAPSPFVFNGLHLRMEADAGVRARLICPSACSGCLGAASRGLGITDRQADGAAPGAILFGDAGRVALHVGCWRSDVLALLERPW